MHQFFRNAKFAESRPIFAEDEIYKTINVQVDFYPECVQSLEDNGPTNEDVAEAFGQFMMGEFLKAVNEECRKRELNWEHSEKITLVDSNGNEVTSLPEEVEPEYHNITGEFTKIG